MRIPLIPVKSRCESRQFSKLKLERKLDRARSADLIERIEPPLAPPEPSSLCAVASSGFAEFAAQREKARSQASPDAWSQLSAGAKVYVQFAEVRLKLFDLMSSPLGVGSSRSKTDKTEPSERKAYKQLSEALDNLVSSGRITAQRRDSAESALWPLIHGLAVLRRAGALREPLDVSWERMLRFTAHALGIDLADKT